MQAASKDLGEVFERAKSEWTARVEDLRTRGQQAADEALQRKLENERESALQNQKVEFYK